MAERHRRELLDGRLAVVVGLLLRARVVLAQVLLDVVDRDRRKLLLRLVLAHELLAHRDALLVRRDRHAVDRLQVVGQLQELHLALLNPLDRDVLPDRENQLVQSVLLRHADAVPEPLRGRRPEGVDQVQLQPSVVRLHSVRRRSSANARALYTYLCDLRALSPCGVLCISCFLPKKTEEQTKYI